MPTRTAGTRAPQARKGAPAASKASAAKSAAPKPAVVAPKPRGNALGPISVLVGLVALGLGVVPLVGFFTWPVAILAAVLGIIGATRIFRRHAASVAGIVIGALALVVGLAVSVLGVQGFAAGAVAGAAAAPVASALGVLPSASATTAPAATVAVPSVKRILADPTGSRYGGYPASERRFVRALEKADARFATAPTARWTSILASRDAAACRTLTKNRVAGWVGSVHDVGTDEAGNAWVNIEIAPTLVVQTWNNALSDGGQHTLVPRRSPFYRVLTTVSQGTVVRFSGTLLGSATSCLQQQNLTTRMYGLDPNFIVRLTDVAVR